MVWFGPGMLKKQPGRISSTPARPLTWKVSLKPVATWNFEARSAAGSIAVEVEGGGPSLHRLPYAKTDCSGTFEVANNSRSRASLRLKWKGLAEPVVFTTEDNAVLEMTGAI